MKKKILSLSLVLGLTFSSSFVALAASCGNNKKPQEQENDKQPEETTRVYLTVDSSDVKCDYIEGETFDPSGLVVKKITEDKGTIKNETLLKTGEYKLSIESGAVLKASDSEVVVSLTDNKVQPASFKIFVSEKMPTILDRLETIQKSSGYKAVISGSVTTESPVIGPDGKPVIKSVEHDIEKTFAFSPIGWTSSYEFVDLDGNVNEIYSTLINLGTKEEPLGVAAFESDLETGELIPLGSIPKEVIGNYQEFLFDFGTFLIGDPDSNPERIEALSQPSYIFDLSQNSKGQSNNPFDVLNVQLIGKTMQLGSLADCISAVQLKTTKLGMQYDIALENTDPEYDTPVSGFISAQIVEADISEHKALQDALKANPLPVREVNPDFARLMELQKNSYSLSIHEEATEKTPALDVDITFGSDYFALSVVELGETNTLVDGVIAKITPEGAVNQAQFVPVDSENPQAGAEFKVVQTFTPEQIVELGLKSPYELLEIFAVSNTGGIGYLRNRPEFTPLGSLFTSPLLKDVFRNQPPVFIVYDKFGYLGINEYVDYTSGPLPISYTDPCQVAGSLIFWDEKGEGIADDEVKTGMIQNNLLGGWMQMSFSKFGIENPTLELYNSLELPEAPAEGENAGK